MNNILVPLDGSPASETALPVADRLARAFGGEVVLISVSELPESAAQAEEAQRQTGEYLRKAGSNLQSPTRSYAELAGSPSRGITEAVKDEQPLFIVMSTHGHSSVEELLEGSVSSDLLQSSQVPLVLVPPTAQVEATTPA